MNSDEIYNRLCRVFFAEEVRLLDKIHELERMILKSDYDEFVMVELIEAKAILAYFQSYMKDVLRYLAHFG